MNNLKVFLPFLLMALVLLFTCTDKGRQDSMPNRFGVETVFDSGWICNPASKAFHIQGSVVVPEIGQIPGAIDTIKLPNGSDSTYIDTSLLISVLQRVVDTFSWKTFISINWLADSAGSPDSTVCFGSQDGITVWEHWMPGSSVIVAEDSMPHKWQNGLNKEGFPRNSGANSAFNSNANRNFSTAEYWRANPAAATPMSLGGENPEDLAVIDQQGKETLYEIFWNKVAYDYAVDSRLYNDSGRKWFVKNWPNETKGLTVYNNDTVFNIEKEYERAYFSVGNALDSTEYQQGMKFVYTINQGSMLIKSAWKQLSSEDDTSRFHVRRAILQDGSPVKLGLVALHIMHKVAESPQWVWTSFQHVDNAPRMDKDGNLQINPNKDYLYFNKDLKDTNLYNKPPVYFGDKTPAPTQVVQEYLTDYSPDSINQFFHGLIKQADANSIWLNYELVGSQWPYNPDVFRAAGFDPQPHFLANPLMETYHQKTSTCMQCHSKSRFLHVPKPKGHGSEPGTGYFSDFVMELNVPIEKE